MTTSKHESKKHKILTAASMIVMEEGVTKLTLEAVARRAGVSKGGLLYHFSSKEALIKGMVESWTNDFFTDMQRISNNDSEESGKWNRAYAKATFTDLEKDNNNLNSSLMAAMFINQELLNDYREKYNEVHMKLLNDGIDPVQSTIARLALDGLWIAEIFGLSPLDKELEEKVYKEILNMSGGGK